MNKKKDKSPAVRVAWYGVLIALAMVLSYVETLIPVTIGIPGVKLGLANLVVFLALYEMGTADAFAISLLRILLVSMTFGNMAALMYSAAGGLLSFLVMWLCKKSGYLLPVAVSVAGGIAHNIGQLVVAALVLENAAVFSYLPVLLAAGAITGAVIGILGGLAEKRLNHMQLL